MQLLFLGTGAADYGAALTCPCLNCTHMRVLGAPNVRTYASALIDSQLLIDCGPTVPARLAECHIVPRVVTDLIVTHSHEDHLDIPAVAALAGAKREDDAPLHIWANAHACRRLRSDGLWERCQACLSLHEIASGDRFSAAGLSLTCLPATHAPADEDCLTFLISDGDRRLWYATDTAWPSERAWEALSDVVVDCAVIEATFGPLEPGAHPDLLTHHLNWAEAARLRQELVQRGRLSADAPCYATHLSQHFSPPHSHCCETVAASGLRLAHDGLSLVI